MTTEYEKILRTILYLCKLIGIIDMSYVLQSDGLLIQSTDSVYRCLEISRMIILVVLSYFLFKNADFIHVIHVIIIMVSYYCIKNIRHTVNTVR